MLICSTIKILEIYILLIFISLVNMVDDYILNMRYFIQRIDKLRFSESKVKSY